MRKILTISAIFTALAAPIAFAQSGSDIRMDIVVLNLDYDGPLAIMADDTNAAIDVPQWSSAVHAVVGPTGMRYRDTEIDFPEGAFPLEELRDIMPEGLTVADSPSFITRSGETATMTLAHRGAHAVSYSVIATETDKGYDFALEVSESAPGFNAGIPLTHLSVEQPLPDGKPLVALRQMEPGKWIIIFAAVSPAE